jgi:tetratricopeptide (TPR) repeat protein
MLLLGLLLVVVVPAEADWRNITQHASALRDSGRYKEARQLYQRALSLADRPGTLTPELATSLNNLASIEDDLGRYARAERLYLRCIDVWKQLADTNALARPLNNLAVLYSKRGDYEKAEQLYRDSLALRTASDPERARVLNNLGRLYHHQRRFPEAEDYYRRALALQESAPAQDRAGTLTNLATLQFDHGDLRAAQITATSALDLTRDKPFEIDLRVTFAAIASARRDLGEAEQHLVRAATLAETMFGEPHPVTSRVHAEYSRVLTRLKRKREAEEYRRRAAVAAHTVTVADLLRNR